jgi:hypothetical protein
MAKAPKESFLQSERHEIKTKSGGGSLRYEVWGYLRNGTQVVTRYNIAYINHAVCQVDNGRVLGYDNAHNYHHRHWMGNVEPVEFVSFEHTVEIFEIEWAQIVATLKAKGKKS